MQSSEQPMKTPYTLIAHEPEELKKAASIIIRQMVWETTPQGDAYWRTVYQNLHTLAEQAAMIEADNQPCLPSL
jgi:uncharacterized protein (DUF2249 family)